MSRVDDDREAQRTQEQLLLKQRREAERVKTRQAGESAFARRMQEAKASTDVQTQRTLEESAQVDSSHDASLAAEERDALFASTDSELQKDEAQQETHRAGGAASQRARAAKALREERGDESAEGGGRRASAGQSSVVRTQKSQQGRQQDAEQGGEARSLRGQSLKEAADERVEVPLAKGEQQESATDPDAGQNGGSKDSSEDAGAGQKGRQNSQGQLGSFRLNPALMAPVAVVKPRETSASERLRALANEIAQRIVERVRVGKNAAGESEFQIDLRSNVLSGLSIRLSGGNGRIRASFKSHDQGVLKLLREQSDGLKAALENRGIRLEELNIEATA